MKSDNEDPAAVMARSDMTDETPRTPTTAACPHDVIETWGDGVTAVIWACANPDCRLRFYPACRECVDVGHRNIVHEARASLDVLNARIEWEDVLDGLIEWEDVLDGLEVALSYPAEMEVNRERWRTARINLLAALEEPTDDYEMNRRALRTLPDGAEDTAYNRGYNDGEQAILRAAAPLDVERLAEALHRAVVTGYGESACGGKGGVDDPLVFHLGEARAIAREYAALEEPTE